MNLEMRGIYKSFGANDVLKNVDFSLNGERSARCWGRTARASPP